MFMLNPRFELGPIFRSLMRNKVGAVLIACQIAVTMSIVVNAVSIIAQRTSLMSTASGVDEANSFFLTSAGFSPNFNKRVSIEKDINDLRRLSGVVRELPPAIYEGLWRTAHGPRRPYGGVAPSAGGLSCRDEAG